MKVIKITNFQVDHIELSNHFIYVRNDRRRNVENIGSNCIIAKFLCDTGHKNGNEVHCITDTGLILVFNERSKKLVTILIARPAQITRYFSSCYLDTPKDLLKMAYCHQAQNLNCR